MKNRIIKTIAFAGIISLVISCSKTASPIPVAQNNNSAPAAPVAVASCTIQENNDSIFVCDSAYWCYKPNSCAVMIGFSGPNKKIEVFLCKCDYQPLTSGAYTVDEIGGSPHYIDGLKQYKTAGAQSLNVNALGGNLVSGDFNFNMQGSVYAGIINTINGPTASYNSVPDMRLKVIWENIPFHP